MTGVHIQGSEGDTKCRAHPVGYSERSREGGREDDRR
jgi:hypothetical protein